MFLFLSGGRCRKGGARSPKRRRKNKKADLQHRRKLRYNMDVLRPLWPKRECVLMPNGTIETLNNTEKQHELLLLP